jgi:hypothetical protein
MCKCLNFSARLTLAFLGQKMLKILFIYLCVYLFIYLRYFICEQLILTELKAKFQGTYSGTEKMGKGKKQLLSLLLYPMDYPQTHRNFKRVIFILRYQLTHSFSHSFRSFSYDSSIVPS